MTAAPPFTTPEGVRLPHAPASWPFGTLAPAPPLAQPQAWPQRPARAPRRGIDDLGDMPEALL